MFVIIYDRGNGKQMWILSPMLLRCWGETERNRVNYPSHMAPRRNNSAAVWPRFLSGAADLTTWIKPGKHQGCPVQWGYRGALGCVLTRTLWPCHQTQSRITQYKCKTWIQRGRDKIIIELSPTFLKKNLQELHLSSTWRLVLGKCWDRAPTQEYSESAEPMS